MYISPLPRGETNKFKIGLNMRNGSSSVHLKIFKTLYAASEKLTKRISRK